MPSHMQKKRKGASQAGRKKMNKRSRLQGGVKDSERAKRYAESESKLFQRAMAGGARRHRRQASEVARFGIHYAFH